MTPGDQGSAGAAPLNYRVGIGEDTHRLVDGGPLILGGVSIAHDQHLEGHSDADALLHAITDAMLGGAGLPDIGELFPNTRAENRGRDSAEILRVAADRVDAAGWQIVNVDAVVAAEAPRLSPYKDAMRQRIAAILELDPTCVNLKAKTGEGVGPVGRREAIEARCVVMLRFVGL